MESDLKLKCQSWNMNDQLFIEKLTSRQPEILLLQLRTKLLTMADPLNQFPDKRLPTLFSTCSEHRSCLMLIKSWGLSRYIFRNIWGYEERIINSSLEWISDVCSGRQWWDDRYHPHHRASHSAIHLVMTFVPWAYHINTLDTKNNLSQNKIYLANVYSATTIRLW